MGDWRVLEFNNLLSDVAAGALLGAAILCLTRGRYLGRSDVASTGLALLILATMRGVLGDLRGGSLTAHSVPFVNIVVISGGSALAIAILFNASYGPQAARQIRRPSAWFISGSISIGVAACLAAFLLRGNGLDEFGFIVLASATAIGWLIVTYRHLQARQPVNRWLPIVLGLTTASAAARVPASLSPDAYWLVLPGAIAVLGAMVAIAGSMLDMRELVVDQREHLANRGHDQERLHDVRSVLAGLQLAATSLTSYEDRIDAPMRRRLHESVSAELIRLRELIEPSASAPPEATEPISLVAAIRPVLDADALHGTTLAVDIDDVDIDVRADEVATIVAALLDNARLYAPGAPVELRTDRSSVGVALEVRDFGPGIDADERASIFDRGRRGSASQQVPGSGLGLYLARHRARTLGGDLTMYAPAGGGAAFVLTIPVAATKRREPAIELAAATIDRDSRSALDWMPEMSWLIRSDVREAAGA
jgi:signal transduction histidine kinase